MLLFLVFLSTVVLNSTVVSFSRESKTNQSKVDFAQCMCRRLEGYVWTGKTKSTHWTDLFRFISTNDDSRWNHVRGRFCWSYQFKWTNNFRTDFAARTDNYYWGTNPTSKKNLTAKAFDPPPSKILQTRPSLVFKVISHRRHHRSRLRSTRIQH